MFEYKDHLKFLDNKHKRMMHWGISIDILSCVICLKAYRPNFISLKFKLKYSYILVTNKLKCHIYWVVEMYVHGMIVCVIQGCTFVAK
jgi:hypothetical protein